MDGDMIGFSEFSGQRGTTAEELAAEVINGELMVIMFQNVAVDLNDKLIFGKVHAVAECNILGTDLHYGHQGVNGPLLPDRNPGNRFF